MNKASKKEEKLLRKLLKEDKAAFEVFFHDNYKTMVGFAWRVIKDTHFSEEVASDAFMRLWNKLKTKKDFESLSSLRGYLYRIVYHRSLEFIKKRPETYRAFDHGSEETMAAEQEKELARIAWEVEQYTRVYEAVRSLKKRQYKQVLELEMKEGLTMEEIAEKLGISTSHARKQKSVAVNKVVELIKSTYYICHVAWILILIIHFFLKWLKVDLSKFFTMVSVIFN